jgi:hypothetical protein
VIIIVTEKGIVASKLVLPKGGKVTRRSIMEYAEAVQRRYLRASKKKKTEILDEFVANTKLHRKAAIRLLNRSERSPGEEKEWSSEVI